MNDNTIEIRDDKINVEEIMEKIREKIRRRQAAGELPPDPDSVIESTSKNCYAGESNDAIQRDISYINSNWDIRNNSYFISSHHPYIGKFLVQGRQLVHGEIRRYVDPMIFRQTEFNASTVRIINQVSSEQIEFDQRIAQNIDKAIREIKDEIDTHEQKQEQLIENTRNEIKDEIDAHEQKQKQLIERAKGEFDQLVSATVTKIQQDVAFDLNETRKSQQGEIESVRKNIELITHKTEKQINEMISRTRLVTRECVDARLANRFDELLSLMDGDIHSRAWLAHILEERIATGRTQACFDPKQSPVEGEINYFLFEERFRGSRLDIKNRQLEFLPYFEKCSRVLDIGCGRGEFLEILKDHGIGGIGVDADPDMVAYCRSRQLEVEHSDAIAYLETLEDKSLDGIFIDQVVEHLEPDYLIRLFVLCHQKMKFGYHIVVVTVNPLSFVSFVNFYIDMTHKRPVHPETLQYLLIASGFRECEKKFLSPVSDECRLKKIEDTADMNATETKNVDVYNHNVEMLNTVLFGAQDYAVVGKK